MDEDDILDVNDFVNERDSYGDTDLGEPFWDEDVYA